jgi:WD40 repeat protein
VGPLVGHRSNSIVQALAVSPDGELFSAYSDHTIRVWSPIDESQTRVVEMGDCNGLLFGPKGTLFVSLLDGTIEQRSTKTGALLRTVIARPDANNSMLRRPFALGSDNTLYSMGSGRHRQMAERIHMW